jgi:hypothetical protein
MDISLADLPPAAQALLGGAGTGMVGVLLFVWRAYREWKKDRREEAEDQAKREKERQGRLTSGFTALDTARDKEITRLSDALDAADRRYADAKRRWTEDLDRERREHEGTRLDRDRGWNLARECDDALHAMRHDANNQIQQAYSAGKIDADVPPGIPPIPPLYSRAGKRPD